MGKSKLPSAERACSSVETCLTVGLNKKLPATMDPLFTTVSSLKIVSSVLGASDETTGLINSPDRDKDGNIGSMELTFPSEVPI